MLETTPKSSEVIQAQIATFAAERVGRPLDREHIFNNLGNLALGEARNITRVAAADEYHRGQDGDNSFWVAEGTEMTTSTAAEYTDFLRSVGGSQYEATQRRAEMLKEYGRFRPAIAGLRTELANLATRNQHPDFLGDGVNATAFSVTDGGKSYAVRVPKTEDANPAAVDSYIAGAVLGKGIPHLAQIVAASYEDGVTVAEVMPGKEVGNLTPNEINGVTDEQLGELVDTLAAASKLGVEIDPKPANLFYDPKAGFGIIDYRSSKVAGKGSMDQELGEIVGRTAMTMDNAGLPHRSGRAVEDYAHDLEFMKANLGVLQRYRRIVETKLSGKEQQSALTEIDEYIALRTESVDNYSNPQWVNERIIQDKIWKQQQVEQAKKAADDDGKIITL